MKAYAKDIWRSIGKSKTRFFALALIAALGVTVFTGIHAAVQNMYDSADQFYDAQHLFDIRIQSTLGLTQEDVAALQNLSFVEVAEGGYSEKVYTQVNGNRKSAEMIVLSAKGLNMPYVLEGAIPARAGEIAVTRAYMEAAGKSIGDTLRIQEDLEEAEEHAAANEPAAEPAPPAPDKPEDDDALNTEVNWDAQVEVESEAETPTFSQSVYTITGVVLDAMNIGDNEAVSFRSVKTTDYVFFIPPQSADYEVFTVAYLRLLELSELDAFSGPYEEAVQRGVDAIETQIKADREQRRYDYIVNKALAKISDAQAIMREKFADADAQFADAWQEVADAKAELIDGEAELASEEQSALRELANARAELNDGRAELLDGQAELEENAQKLAEGREELEEGKKTFAEESALAQVKFADAQAQIDAAQAELSSGLDALHAQLGPLKSAYGVAWPEEAWNAYVSRVAELTVLGKSEEEAGPERDALFASLAGLVEALQQAIRDTEEALEAANARIRDIDAALPEALLFVVNAQAALREEEAAVADAEAALSALDSADPGYEQALETLNAAQARMATAEDALATANGVVAGLEAERDALSGAAEQYAAAQKEMDAQLLQFGALPAQTVAAAAGLGKLRGSEMLLAQNAALLEAAKQELRDAEDLLAQSELELIEGEHKIKEARLEIREGWIKLREGEAELNKNESTALRKLKEARAEIADGKQDLAEGEAKLVDNEKTYREKQAQARRKIADAYEELRDIDMTQWYVQDRASLSSYAGMKNDLESINVIGTAFPILFLVVAVLISLTTMSRMVEEERGLIGTYKALGFGDSCIYRKYILYALLACLLGGMLGNFFGFVALPLILSSILRVLYLLPQYLLRFDALYGIGGVLLFAGSISGATALACRTELKRTPASLMRPKAPRAGSRVFLERIPFLWNRLKFLGKVTLRNLFRYKKRLLMTVTGIMGCTALILAGFAIKDSVAALLPRQYTHIYQYDLMATADCKDNSELLALMENSDEIADFLNLQIGSIKVFNAMGDSENVQLMVIPQGGSLEGYINLVSKSGAQVAPGKSGILLTRNAAELLALQPGDPVRLQNLQLDERETGVADVLENYIGNTVYIGQGLYESLFGAYEPNGILARLSGSAGDPIGFADSLLEHDFVTSSLSISALQRDFSRNFSLINTVVYVLLLLAAGLAFVVLYTLSNTNISERARELATIKVLGFFEREVHAYINKETLILTLLGILAGLPAGRMISALLLGTLKMPSIHFALSIKSISYVIAAAISLCFALIVTQMTDRTLDRINMVEALKSVE